MNVRGAIKALGRVSLPCAALIVSAAAAELRQEDIFVAGQNGYHTYRIPSLIVTKNGTLLAFCEGRKNSSLDTGDIDVVLKRSTDEGQTWTPQQVVWDDGTNTCGNPCPVIDQRTGAIWLFLTHNLGGDREAAIIAKKGKGTRTVWLSKSTDDGETWSKPADITASVKDPSWTWYATGPGIGIQIQQGAHKSRLVVPCDHFYSTEKDQVQSGSHVIYSDDHGKSWKLGGRVGPNVNECQVVELADGKGTLLLSMRNYPKGSQRAQSLSYDGGATWSETERHAELVDPTCQASILRCTWPTDNNRGRILFSNPASSQRRNMTVRLSYDDGKTWPIAKVLHEKASAYSCLAMLSAQRIGCLYERGDGSAYEKITFAQFSLSWLEAR